jgi:hypothetical protein
MQFGGDALSRGRGELVINASGRTFMREKRMTYEVVPPVNLQLTPDETGMRLSLQAAADSELIDPVSLRAKIWLEDESGGREAVSLDGEPGSYSGLIDLQSFSGPRRVVIEADAKALSGDPISFFDAPADVEGIGAPAPAPEPAPEPPPAAQPTATPEPPSEPAPPPVPQPQAEVEESGWLSAALWFGVINLLLLALGGGLIWWLRMRAQRNLVQLVDEDDADEAPPPASDKLANAETKEQPA